MHLHRKTCILFKGSLVLPVDIVRMLRQRGHTSIQAEIRGLHDRMLREDIHVTLPEGVNRVELPSRVFLQCGYHPGDALLVEYDGDMLAISAFKLPLEHQIANTEIGDDGVPIPPAWMIQAFTGVPNTGDHVENGKKSAKFYVDLYNRLCGDYAEVKSVLDFGCGCGRVLSRLPRNLGAKYFGRDLHAPAVEWLSRILPDFDVRIGTPLPPLNLETQEIDFLYAISVLTHLSQEQEEAWLGEWARVVKSGGHLFVTFRGEDWVDHFATEEQRRQIFDDWSKSGGFSYNQHKYWDGVFPEFYAGTYQTVQYVHSHWGSAFEILEIVPALESPNQQNIAVMRRA